MLDPRLLTATLVAAPLLSTPRSANSQQLPAARTASNPLHGSAAGGRALSIEPVRFGPQAAETLPIGSVHSLSLDGASVATDQLRFAPAEGTALSKTFEADLQLQAGKLEVKVDGSDVGGDFGMPHDLQVKLHGGLKVTDEYRHCSDGRLLDLVRSFDAVEGSLKAGGVSLKGETPRPLEGRRVRFLWNAGEKRYDASFADGIEPGRLELGKQGQLEGSGKGRARAKVQSRAGRKHPGGESDDLLRVLSEDMDLRALLPEGRVSGGDSWDVDARALSSVLLPGVRLDGLAGLWKDEHDLGRMGEAIAPELQKLVRELGARCTFQGVREEGGRRLGVVSVELRGHPVLDLSRAIEAAIDEDGTDVSIRHARASCGAQGQGELLWDLDAGHLDSFELHADFEIQLDAAVDVADDGQTRATSLSGKLGGTGAWKLRQGGS